ncbi:hypothetical protein PSENEW3_00000460 [Picochlorum sp. SENEW3]|nr:hypothetical protein PSENEW3_00000460 [Picochlorum sp. SENEW3]
MKTTTALLVSLSLCVLFFSTTNAKVPPRFKCPIKSRYLEERLIVSEVNKYCIKGIKNGGKKGCDTCVAKIIPELDAGLLADIDFPSLFAYMKDPEYTLKEKMKGVYNSCHSKFKIALRRKGVSDKDLSKLKRNVLSCSWDIDQYPQTTEVLVTVIEDSLGALMQPLG